MKIFFVIFMILTSAITSANEPNTKRLLLSTLRGGDYAHPGETEAIDLVLKNILALNPGIKQAKVLDIGCGFGGSLEYLRNKGFQNLYGIDISQESIDYAKTKYPKINFIKMDALEADNLQDKFELIMLFNSIYAISDKSKLLQILTKIAKPGAILVIFDYSSKDSQQALKIKDFAGKAMYPINLSSFKQSLSLNNWDIVKTEDLSKQYIIWYQQFLHKLDQQKPSLKLQYSKKDIDQVQASFSYFLNELKTNKMGGIVIYARKR